MDVTLVTQVMDTLQLLRLQRLDQLVDMDTVVDLHLS
jgi:hypothetical protein